MATLVDHDTALADAHTEQPSLSGRRALVSGGTTGIGRAIAILLASEGAKVFVCGRNPEHLEDALGHIRSVGEGDGIAVDVSTRDGVTRFVTAAEEFLGGIDIAVINAAVPAEGLDDVEPMEADYQIAVDFTSYLVSAQEVARRMEEGSDIVLIGSMSAVSRDGGNSIYVAAKAGIDGFVAPFRKEMAKRDIKVGLIEPGFTGADFQYPEYPEEKQRALINADQMLRAEDIAVAAHFMLTQPRRSAVSLIRVEPRLEEE